MVGEVLVAVTAVVEVEVDSQTLHRTQWRVFLCDLTCASCINAFVPRNWRAYA